MKKTMAFFVTLGIIGVATVMVMLGYICGVKKGSTLADSYYESVMEEFPGEAVYSSTTGNRNGFELFEDESSIQYTYWIGDEEYLVSVYTIGGTTKETYFENPRLIVVSEGYDSAKIYGVYFAEDFTASEMIIGQIEANVMICGEPRLS